MAVRTEESSVPSLFARANVPVAMCPTVQYHLRRTSQESSPSVFDCLAKRSFLKTIAQYRKNCPFQKWIALISEVDLSEREEMGISNVRDFRNTMCPF